MGDIPSISTHLVRNLYIRALCLLAVKFAVKRYSFPPHFIYVLSWLMPWGSVSKNSILTIFVIIEKEENCAMAFVFFFVFLVNILLH